MTEVSFKDFLINNKRNKTILWLAAAAIVIQFAVFKYFYPFASYIHGDSFAYINAAYDNLNINTYPIGYSKFLRLFNVFTKSDLILVAFQYILIQISSSLFLFTIFFFYKTDNIVKIILLSFSVFNPLYLHLSNLISSDGMFLALSLSWFTILLWTIHVPSQRIYILHAIVLFLCFTVRYNALVYPFISAIAFCISKTSFYNKILGLSVSLFLCGLFVFYTSFQYKKLTGQWQYSPFSGWQLANNAMYTYRYVNRTNQMPVPKKFQRLDNMVREYFDSTRDYIKYPQEALLASTVYMWTRHLTLYKYRDNIFITDKKASEMKKWASIGPFYKDYGIFIITKYPKYFLRYFIWPNANRYYAPPVEYLEYYNGGKDTVTTIAAYWFGYKSKKIKANVKDNRIHELDFYPILSGIFNIMLFCTLICYILLKGWRYNYAFGKGIFIGATMWLINALFTISASSAALRFQAFPIFLTVTFSLLLVNWMWQMIISGEIQSTVIRQETIDSNKTRQAIL